MKFKYHALALIMDLHDWARFLDEFEGSPHRAYHWFNQAGEVTP